MGFLERRNWLVLFVFFLGICSNELSGQRNEATAELHMTKVLPVGDTAFISIKTNDRALPGQVGIQFYHLEKQAMISERIVEFTRRQVDGQLEDVLLWDGKLILLHSLFFPGPKRNHLFLETYTLPDLVKTETKLIDEAYTPQAIRVPFGYHISPDSSKMLFYSWSYALPDDPAKVNVQVLDKNLEQLWRKRFLLPYKNEKLYLYGCRVNNDGRAYILGEEYAGKIGPTVQIQAEKIRRFALYVDPTEKDLIEYKVDLKEDVVSDMKFILDDDQNLIAAGYYKSPNKTLLSGVFVYKVSHQTKRSILKKYPIDKEEFKAVYPYAEKESIFSESRKGFESYFVDHILVSENGQITIVGEHESVDRGTRYLPDYAQNLLIGDIFLTKVDDDQVLWKIRVPKRQSQVYGKHNPAYSYGLIEEEDALFLLFNDHVENHLSSEVKTLRKLERPANSVNVIARVSNDGQLQKHLFIDENALWTGEKLIIPKIHWRWQRHFYFAYFEGVPGHQSPGKFIALNIENLGFQIQ